MTAIPGGDIRISIAALGRSLMVEMAISTEDLNEIRAIAAERKIGIVTLTADVLRGRASSLRTERASLQAEVERFEARAAAMEAAAAHIEANPESFELKTLSD